MVVNEVFYTTILRVKRFNLNPAHTLQVKNVLQLFTLVKSKLLSILEKGSMQNVGCHLFCCLAYARLYNIREKRKQTTVNINNSISSGVFFLGIPESKTVVLLKYMSVCLDS